MEEPWELFKEWVAGQPDGVEITSVHMCVYSDEQGWVGDGAHGIAFEFDTIAEGITQLEMATL